MPVKETLGKLFGKGRRQAQPSGEVEIEGIGDKTIGFYDLREPAKAKERNVEPGFYLTASPITSQEIENPMILNLLTFQFFDKLGQLGLMKRSDTFIPIDNIGKLKIDPSQGWLFSQTGYIQESQLLVVQASPVDRDTNQMLIVQALNKKS